MVDPFLLVTTLTDLIRDIPEMSDLMDKDPVGNIQPYVDQFAAYASQAVKVRDMTPPAVLVSYMGTYPGGNGADEMAWWTHRVSIAIKTGTQTPEQPSAYTQVYRAIVKGVPASRGIQMGQLQVLDNLNPMDLPSLERRNDPEGIDYFEMILTFTEIGDD